MACPVMVASRTSGGSAAPSATRSWSRTRSSPVTSSVTGCSTWRRVLTSKKAMRPSGSDQELDGAGIHVADGAGHGDRSRAQLGAQLRGHGGRGALLDDLLVTTLDRALALEEVHDVAVRVTQDLHLDVARTRRRTARRTRCRPRRPRPPLVGRRQRVAERLGAAHDTHAATAAAGRRLHEHGPPQGRHRFENGVGAGPCPGAAPAGGDLHGREHGHPRRRHRGLGGQLRAHGLDDRGRGPDEHEPRGHTGPGEPGVFGQEPVAGVHGVGPAGERPRPPAASVLR